MTYSFRTNGNFIDFVHTDDTSLQVESVLRSLHNTSRCVEWSLPEDETRINFTVDDIRVEGFPITEIDFDGTAIDSQDDFETGIEAAFPGLAGGGGGGSSYSGSFLSADNPKKNIIVVNGIITAAEPPSFSLVSDQSSPSSPYFYFEYPGVAQGLVDWGDGTIDSFNADASGGLQIDHTYTIAGDYTVALYFTDVAGITYLDLGTLKVKSFTSLEAFTNLETLDLSGNKMTSITVSEMANLTDFLCSGATSLLTLILNVNNGAISTIDISGSNAITQLLLNNNNLTGVDVSSLSDLEQLYLSHNPLTGIDVSNNPLLQELRLINCGLTTINLSANTALWLIELDINGLTTLDISANILLTDFQCSQNQIGVTDISNILIALDGGNLDNGIADVSLQTPAAIPNAGGQTAKTNLEGKGWTVVVDS